MALHQSYIIGKFIMLHVRLLNFVFGRMYHVQSIAAYRATVRDVITQYKFTSVWQTVMVRINVFHT